MFIIIHSKDWPDPGPGPLAPWASVLTIVPSILGFDQTIVYLSLQLSQPDTDVTAGTTATQCLADQFTVTSPGFPTPPIICGKLLYSEIPETIYTNNKQGLGNVAGKHWAFYLF